jgi:hypothetical protein
MSRFKRKKQVRFLPLLLSLQLFIPSTLLADTKEYQHWKKTAQTLQMFSGMSQQMVQQHQQRMMQQQAMQMKMSLQRDLALTPVDPSQVPPILTQNGCMVLPARSNRTSGGISCEAPYDPAKLQSGVYDALLEVAEANHNTVANFLTEGHQRFSTQGLGCYDKAENNLKQELEGRIELLSAMEESLTRKLEKFEKDNRGELLNIKKADALLNGGSSDKEVAAALKNFRFEDQFRDPACRSFFNDQNIKKMAKKGYRGIEEAINQKNSQLNPSAFLAKSSQLKKEIEDLGKHVARKHSNSDGLEAKDSSLLSGFNGRLLSTDSKAIKRVLGITNDMIREENKQVVRELEAVIPSGDKLVASLMQDAQKGIERGTLDLGFRLSEFEKETKNKCLGEYIKNNFGGVDGFTSRLQDPNVSKKANEEADSSFKNYIEEILSDSRLTVETKKKKIEQAQTQGSNQRYGMVTGKSITVEGKNISASTRMPASSMVSMFVDNCVARFESEPDPKTGKTYRDVANAVRSYSNKFKKMKSKLTSKLQSNLVNELLRCPSDENTGKASMSCDDKSLQTGSQNFCLRTANNCAANLNGCLDKAQAKVEETRATQKVIVDKYRGKMEVFKNELREGFANLARDMDFSARKLDGMYQMGTMYKMPIGLDLQTMVNEKTLMKGIDESLQIEDPKIYAKTAKQNIAKLKKSIEKQNKEVMTAFKKERKKYEKNYGNEMKHWKKVAKDCKQRIVEHNAMVQKQNEANDKAFAKQQEEIKKSCERFKDFRRNPCPASGNEVGSLSEDIAAIGNYLGDSVAIIDDVATSCQNVEAYDIPNTGVTNSEKYQLSLDEFCAENGAGGDSINCQIYTQNKKKYRDFMLGNTGTDVALCSSSQPPLKASDSEIYCKLEEVIEGQESRVNRGVEIIAASSCQEASTDTKIYTKVTYDNLDSYKEEYRNRTGCAASREIASENGIKARFESARDGAMEELEGYRRNQMAESMGQVQLAACDGIMGGGEVDMTGDPIQQIINGMSNGGAMGIAH